MIYVLIPAFDEAVHLGRLLPKIPVRLGDRQVRVVVACDGSTDGTCQVVSEQNVELLALWPNSGKGAAVRAAAARLAGRTLDAVVTMDADGQHDPGDLHRLVGPVLSNNCDIAIGSRYLNDPGRGPTPLNRYLVRNVFTRLLRHRLQQPVTDPFSGYRCMSPRAFEQIRLTGNAYENELEVRFEAELHGLSVVEVPIAKTYGRNQSKMGAAGGPLRGRVRVLHRYAATTRRKTRELAAARQDAPLALGP